MRHTRTQFFLLWHRCHLLHQHPGTKLRIGRPILNVVPTTCKLIFGWFHQRVDLAWTCVCYRNMCDVYNGILEPMFPYITLLQEAIWRGNVRIVGRGKELTIRDLSQEIALTLVSSHSFVTFVDVVGAILHMRTCTHKHKRLETPLPACAPTANHQVCWTVVLATYSLSVRPGFKRCSCW